MVSLIEGRDGIVTLSYLPPYDEGDEDAEIARRAGVGRESLYKSLSGDVTPTFETVLKVLTAVGLRLAVAPGSAGGRDRAA